MATFMQPVLPFLRPLGPPKPATIRHFLRFSHSASPRAATAGLDSNLIASQTASPSYPPPTIKSIARPRESHASHRTSQPTKQRSYPDRATRKPLLSASGTPVSTTVAAPTTPLTESEVSPNLPYYITRTPSNELPIYTLKKRGGNLRQTRVKKISGNIDSLRDALQVELAVPEKECVINRLTNHVVIKGWHRPRIEAFLSARKF